MLHRAVGDAVPEFHPIAEADMLFPIKYCAADAAEPAIPDGDMGGMDGAEAMNTTLFKRQLPDQHILLRRLRLPVAPQHQLHAAVDLRRVAAAGQPRLPAALSAADALPQPVVIPLAGMPQLLPAPPQVAEGLPVIKHDAAYLTGDRVGEPPHAGGLLRPQLRAGGVQRRIHHRRSPRHDPEGVPHPEPPSQRVLSLKPHRPLSQGAAALHSCKISVPVSDLYPQYWTPSIGGIAI